MFIKPIIMGDRMWVYYYDDNHHSNHQYIFTKTKKACQVRSNVKVMLMVFFGNLGVIGHEFLFQDKLLTDGTI